MNAFVAHTVRITCAAYGSPLPRDISWTGPGGSITSGGKVKVYTNSQTVNATVFLVSTLEICGVTVADSGQYNCTASDNSVAGSVGSNAASTVLTVTDKAAGMGSTEKSMHAFKILKHPIYGRYLIAIYFIYVEFIATIIVINL